MKDSTTAAVFGLAGLIFSAVLGAAPTRISDLETFVSQVYRRLAANETLRPGQAIYNEPDDIYTPRLKALFAEYNRRTQGEAGCLDFDFWLNAQDSTLRNVRITSRDVAAHPDRKLVIATFVNGAPQEIQFDFRRIAGQWLLNDVHSLKHRLWTLSETLRCPL